MIMNVFSAAWFIVMALQIVFIVILAIISKGKSYDEKEKIYKGLYIFLIIYYVAYKGYLIWGSKTYETSVLNELPLALCQVASLLTYPGVATKSKALQSFSFFIGSVCATLAMLMPVAGFTEIPLLSGEAIGYYGYHGLVIVMCVSLYTMKIYNPEIKHVPFVMLQLALYSLISHVVNFIIRSNTDVAANYFFTYDPEGNPILKIFRNLIDINYVYLLPLIIPVGAVLAAAAPLLHRKETK